MGQSLGCLKCLVVCICDLSSIEVAICPVPEETGGTGDFLICVPAILELA